MGAVAEDDDESSSDAVAKLLELLEVVLPSVAAHEVASVREKAATFITEILQSCTRCGAATIDFSPAEHQVTAKLTES